MRQKKNVVASSKNALKIVGISACATGVVHTYMARDAILDAAKKLNWTAAVETQGQKGPEFILTDEQINDADAVILAVDISVDLDRFIGKKVFKIGTKELINDPETAVRSAISKGKVMTKDNADAGGTFDVKNGRAWIRHIMSGISFMIPFIVFAGIIFAIVTGIGKIAYGTWLDYSGTFENGLAHYVQSGIAQQSSLAFKGGANAVLMPDGTYTATIDGAGIALLYCLNQFANIGFTVMIPIMGAYIANSIAGRSAMTPAFVLSWAASNPNMWWHWGFFSSNIESPLNGEQVQMDSLFPSNGAGIFGALLFGFIVGYTVKWINAKWRINKYIKPIMPIIIIPVFVSLFYGVFVLFLFGNIFGLIMGYFNFGLQKLENSGVGMAALGLVLGLIAGIDMGGPINKIASFGATALIATDGGRAMGCAAAAFAIAPLGAGVSTFIFKRKFADDRALGINATILGFMGVSEGAIPFAAKYTWAAFIPNIICSGVAGMLAGLFHVSGWVGAWGGPIIALFGGVTTTSMSYVGILWYFAAIIIAVALHIVIFRILVEIQTDRGAIGSVKAAHLQFVEQTRKEFNTNIKNKQNILQANENECFNQVKQAKLNNGDVLKIKTNFKNIISTNKVEINELKKQLRDILSAERKIYKETLLVEKAALKDNASTIKKFTLEKKDIYNRNQAEIKEKLKNIKQQENTKQEIINANNSYRNNMLNLLDNFKIELEQYQANYREPALIQYQNKIKTVV